MVLKKVFKKRCRFLECMCVFNIIFGSVAIGLYIGSTHYIILSILAFIVAFEFRELYKRWSCFI